MIPDALAQVSAERMRRSLFHLSRDPLPFRKANYTRPGQAIDSLAEADAHIRGQLALAGCKVTEYRRRVQAFRCDRTKPVHHWYAAPRPEDPWYRVSDIEAVYAGHEHPGDIIQLISHKDSPSWIDSPGAHDNAAGTVANLELLRVLSAVPVRRTIRVLFCNEEHTPWTSRSAAAEAAARGDNIIAVLNVDSLSGKSDEDMAAGRLTHTVCYSTAEGGPLAAFVAGCARRYGIKLDARAAFKQPVNDDDGMFIDAGYRAAVMNVGSWPYADTKYHLPGDVPERVNVNNLVRSTQLLLGALLELDAGGAAAFQRA